ncbi:PD40 domain-containing protein, partial [bacterium]|nr:PD40 domain-containing protein [bacterium]
STASAQEGRLAFSAYDEAAGRHLCYTYDLETDDLREVPLPVEADCGDLALIYDGSRVAVELEFEGEELLYVCPTRTGERALHPEPFPGAEPSWIEYTTLCYTIDGDLWHWNGVTDPLMWQADVGRSPVHRDWLNVYYILDYEEDKEAVAHLNVNEGVEELIHWTPGRYDDFDVSPDGFYLTLSWNGDDGGLFVLHLEEGEETEIVRSKHELRYPSFSPDGEWLAYYDVGTEAILAAPLEGGEPVELYDLAGRSCRGLDWAPTPEDW